MHEFQPWTKNDVSVIECIPVKIELQERNKNV